MKTLPIELQQEVIEEVIHVQHLVTLETSTSIYRWTEGQGSIYYGGNWWISKGIEFDPTVASIVGQVDNITMTVDNVDNVFSDLVLSSDLRGSECTISRVFLDNNFSTIGTPVILFKGYVDQIEMDRKTARIEIFSHMVKWRQIVPRRQHTPTCAWTFKSIECKFFGWIFRNPTSDRVTEWNRSAGNNSWFLVDDRLTDLGYASGTPTADSESGAGNNATYAFDRNNSTYWESGNNTASHWLQYQFSANKRIRKISIHQSSNTYSPIDFIFQASNDGNNWIDVYPIKGVTWGNETFKDFDFVNSNNYGYYRLYMTKWLAGANNTMRIKELMLYGDEYQVNDSDYTYTNNVNLMTDQFYYPDVIMANDMNNISLYIYTRASQSVPSARNLMGRIMIGGTYYNSSQATPANSVTLHAFSWLTNPCSNENWNPNNFRIPSDICSGGNATADNEVGGYEANKAFDGNNSTLWQATTTVPHWIRYEFASQKTVKEFSILPYTTYLDTYLPKDFTFQGSNDGNNWTTLYTGNNVSGYATSTKKYFSFLNANSFNNYRLYITALGSGNQVVIAELDMYENMHVESFGYATPAQAGGNNIYVTQCYMKITANASTCNLTPERCELLNNRDNFGGFAYIHELQTKEFWWGTKQKIWGGRI